MNKRKILFLLPIILILIFCMGSMGFNGLGFFFTILFSVIYVMVAAGIVDGVTKAKGEMYLSKKYDDEKKDTFK